jgi:hypothetical protein
LIPLGAGSPGCEASSGVIRIKQFPRKEKTEEKEDRGNQKSFRSFSGLGHFTLHKMVEEKGRDLL